MATSSIIARRLKDIREVLDESFFTSAGFEIDPLPTEPNTLLYINFRENINFKFKLFIDHGTPSIEQSPGKVFFIQETYTIESYENVTDAVRDWTQAIKEECISINALQRELDEFSISFDKRIDEHIKDDTSHFTTEEREKLYEMLDQIQARLENFESEQKITQCELDLMREIIADLKFATYSMKKRSWWRVTGHKLFVAGNKIVSSPIGKMLVEGIKAKYLP